MKKLTVLFYVFLLVGLTANAQLMVNTNVTANDRCHGGSAGSIQANAMHGMTPYTYSWAPGGQTTSTISSLTA